MAAKSSMVIKSFMVIRSSMIIKSSMDLKNWSNLITNYYLEFNFKIPFIIIKDYLYFKLIIIIQKCL